MVSKYRGVDLDAVTCLDVGHAWVETFYGRAQSGVLKGVVARVVVCDRCDSEKAEHLSWDGRVISRRYMSEPAYIENARALSDDVHDRKRALREARAERFKAAEKRRK